MSGHLAENRYLFAGEPMDDAAMEEISGLKNKYKGEFGGWIDLSGKLTSCDMGYHEAMNDLILWEMESTKRSLTHMKWVCVVLFALGGPKLYKNPRFDLTQAQQDKIFDLCGKDGIDYKGLLNRAAEHLPEHKEPTL